jgi:hypothetical protein
VLDYWWDCPSMTHRACDGNVYVRTNDGLWTEVPEVTRVSFFDDRPEGFDAGEPVGVAVVRAKLVLGPASHPGCLDKLVFDAWNNIAEIEFTGRVRVKGATGGRVLHFPHGVTGSMYSSPAGPQPQPDGESPLYT